MNFYLSIIQSNKNYERKNSFLLFYLLSFIFLLISFPAFAQNSKLISVDYQTETKEINIKSEKGVTPKLLNLENPVRIVIDLPDTIFSETKKNLEINDELIKQIRIAQFSKEPLTTRITIELKQVIPYEFLNFEEKSFHVLKLLKSEQEEKTTEKTEPVISINNDNLKKHKVSAKNKIINKKNLELIELNQDKLILTSKEKIEYEISKTNEPDIYLVKFPALATDGLKEIPVKDDLIIKSIKIKEKEDESIFTLQINPDYQMKTRENGNKGIEFYFEKIVRGNSENNLLVNFSEDEGKVYLSAASKSLDYKIFTLENPDRLVIETYGTSIESFQEIKPKDPSRFIERIRFGLLEKSEKNPEGVKIVLDLRKKLTFQQELFGEDKILELKFGDQLANKKYYVVLDPGHGGRDPGAIGTAGTREKEVTLKVTNYLRDLLDKNGIGVILTRTDDTEVLLQPRVDIANNNGASLFVSIHCNAMDRSSPKGIETYYRTPQSSNLAKTIHKAMTKMLPTYDRGIRTMNFFVIRKTTMPSVLLEIGYLTNKQEELMLASANYQKQVAEAIYQGISEYFKNQQKI